MMTINFKRNTRIFVLSFVILAVLSIIIFKGGLLSFKEKPIYIALVHSMNANYQTVGEGMLRGAQMYIDSVNQKGGVNGKQLELVIFDDQGDVNKAEQIATDIVAKNQVLAVIGHLYSSTCLKVGHLYKNAGIPAITPDCTTDAVTEENDWYFRVIPNNKFQGAFLANYVKRIMKHDSVNIIYNDQYAYYASITEGFENSFRGLRGSIKNKWLVNGQGNVEQQVEEITRTLLREDPRPIFISVSHEVREKLIVSMKRKGLQFPVIVNDISTINFDVYPEEQVQPGYFSEDIYTSSPLLFDVASEEAQKARVKYIEKYYEEPNWMVAIAYDAAKVTVEAIQKTDSRGFAKNLIEERQKMRNYLATKTSIENAFEGINGPFYFDKHGSAIRVPVMGTFQNQKLISAMTQFQAVADPTHVINLEKELAAEHIVIVAGQYMYKTNIVYTGIDFNEVHNIDTKNSTYELDFYLWFRSKTGVDASNIEFINSITHSFKELKLKTPIAEKTLKSLQGDISYKVYRVKADFKEKFNFRAYPFDKQKLSIRFRHAHLTHNNLIYVLDFAGIKDSSEKAILDKFKRNNVFGTISDWQVKHATLFQNIMTNESTLGDPSLFDSNSHIEYSQFNAIIEIKRDIVSFITKNLLPLLFLLGISYAIMFLPFKEISVSAVSGTLIAVAFFHLSLGSALPEGIGYAVVLDYGFYVIYGLIIFQLLVIVIGQHDHIKENPAALKHLLLTARLVYPAVFLTVSILAVYFYGDIDLSAYQSPSTTIATVDQTASVDDSKITDKNDQVTLILGSWRAEDIEQINKVLTVFTEKHPNIAVKFQPAVVKWYTKMLQFQFKNHIAPDLFYLRPFSRSKSLFEAGYLEPLENLSGLKENKENFDQQARIPWRFNKGEQYAVPISAISHGIYYNIDVFRKLNLDIPTTWEALLTTAQVIKEARYIPFANGIKTSWATSELIFMNLAPNFIGGREGRLEYESGQRCFNDEHVVAAFKAIADIVSYLPPEPETISYDTSKDLFLQGKAAMFMGASSAIPYFEKEKLNFKWSIFAMPAPAGNPQYVTYHPDFGIGLNASSTHKKEAKLFLEWLAQPETAELFSNELPGSFPMHKTAPTIHNEHAKTFLALNEGRDTDVRWAFPKLMDGIPNGKYLMQKSTEAVIKGEMTPQEAADALEYGLAQWFEPAQKCLTRDSE
ncbi:extracellular solute-binding protein [Candidatus Parabeggiatoa sp. HSG14]|uniref:extracellular solute-binding protein n=1 Tax=Candidatus Parabeggiatoa sp. HSG14 TaxID=3055593 RepID=UPI0025A90459|nr:extracellular solute-binding protein [Thiotrichales bacterium HSG14]